VNRNPGSSRPQALYRGRWALLPLALGLLLFLPGCRSVGGVGAYEKTLSTIDSDPPRASVFIGGGFVGQTPATLYLPAQDRVDLRLEHPDTLAFEDVLVRKRGVPADAEEGVGWEADYYYPLIRKR
jgi:hypothetical protein